MVSRLSGPEREGDSQSGFASAEAVFGSCGQRVSRRVAREGGCQSRMRRAAAARWRGASGEAPQEGWIGARRSVRCSNRGWGLGRPGAQLSTDGDGSEVVPAREFRVSEDEGRGQGECDEEN